MTDLSRLADKLTYQFQDMKLLRSALTHRSAGSKHNERLEFLGDSLLGYFIAHALYQKFPNATEGQLSRLRSNLVNRDTLASIASEFELGRYLRLGPGELKSGGQQRHSILSDTVEAIIAAIFFDSDIESCEACVLRWYASRLGAVSLKVPQKDPKTLLQEYLQGKGLGLPQYKVDKISGEDHAQVFHVQCVVPTLKQTVAGEGRSRRRAEQEAANQMLELLRQKNG